MTDGDRWSKMANKSYFFSKNGKISSKFSNFSAWVTGLVGLLAPTGALVLMMVYYTSIYIYLSGHFFIF